MQNNILVNCDTDSIMITKKDQTPWTEQEQIDFLEALNSQFPELIKWEHDGVYSSVVVIKSKNYALLPEGENKIKTKGSSIRDTKKEPAMREMMVLMIESMIYHRLEELPLIYKKYVQEALNVTEIERWCAKKTISDKILAGADPKNETRKQEQDVWDAIKNEEDKQEGNKIYLYPVIFGEEIIPGGVSEKTGKKLKDKVKVVTGLKLSKYWENDHNVEHLVKRCYDTVKIFKNVLDMDQFIDYSKKTNKHLLEELKNETIQLNLQSVELEEGDEDSDE